MKRLFKLLSLLVILALLITAFVVYSNYQKKDSDDDGDYEEVQTIEMLKIDVDSINSIEYTLDDQLVSLKKGEESWAWADDAEFPMDQEYPEDMASFLSNLTAIREVADTQEGENEYGFDAPTLKVKFTTTSDKEYEYTLGSYNTVADGFYAKITGSNSIYFVSGTASDTFGYYIMDMVESDAIPSVDAESIVNTTIKSPEGEKLITTDSTGAEFYADPYVFFTKNEEGKVIAVDGQAGAELLSSVANLSLGSAEAFKPDDEALSKYGLSADKLTEISVKYKKAVESENSGDTSVNVTTEESFVIYVGIGADEEGETEYYAMVPDSKVVYTLSGGEDFYEAVKAELPSKLVCPVTTEDAVSFKCEIGGSEAVYFYNTADIENNEKIIAVLDKIAALSYVGKSDGQKGELVFKTTFDVGEEEYVLNVYSFDGTNYIASFDVFDGLLIPIEKIDTIITDLKAING